MSEKIIIKNHFLEIAEYMRLQTRFNIDIDKRLTKHDKEIINLQKESRSQKSAIGSLKKYFSKRKM